MISVCIPVFNFKVKPLIFQLQSQFQKVKADYEIILIDDASLPEYRKENECLSEFPFIKYIQLEKNIGRAAIRNLLGQKASYENLLFLDCDSKPASDDFINSYLNNLKGANVICGGTIYETQKPKSKFQLRWRYGKNRESQQPHTSTSAFRTNNFLIKKQLLKQIPFDESLGIYGHEDTLLGIMLHMNNIQVITINNPVYHQGLDTNREFIFKTEQSIESLSLLLNKRIDNSVFAEHIRIFKIWMLLNRLKINKLIIIIFPICKPLIKSLLIHVGGPLVLLDFYKIGLLCARLSRRKTNSKETKNACSF